jgi:hypothetical protein
MSEPLQQPRSARNSYGRTGRLDIAALSAIERPTDGLPRPPSGPSDEASFARQDAAELTVEVATSRSLRASSVSRRRQGNHAPGGGATMKGIV